MAYNPLFDLAIGLFLILVPVLILSILFFLTFIQKPEGRSEEHSSENWEEWLRTTLNQANIWRDRLNGSPTGETDSTTRAAPTPVELDELVSQLERLRNKSSTTPHAGESEEP